MNGSRHTYWSHQLDNLATEISRLCIVCDIKMLEPGIAERVLKGDQSVCGHKNPEIFERIRKHLMAFFKIEEKAIHRLGADEVKNILDEVRASLTRLRGER
jgi:precorrin isomerase